MSWDQWRQRKNCRWHVIADLLDDPRQGVELGVKEGRFSTYLMARFPLLFMHGVDRCEAQALTAREGFETYEEWDWDDILSQLEYNTREFNARWMLHELDTNAAAQRFNAGSVDFVFIDAEHTYEGVSGDIKAWSGKVKPGGLIAGHDYSAEAWPGVTRAVDEAFVHVNVSPHDRVWWIRK